jgi:hypothetical protein
MEEAQKLPVLTIELPLCSLRFEYMNSSRSEPSHFSSRPSLTSEPPYSFRRGCNYENDEKTTQTRYIEHPPANWGGVVPTAICNVGDGDARALHLHRRRAQYRKK